MNLKKAIYWPFRSLANFTIASLGVVGLSFWGYSIYSEGKFNQPIIGESVKLLGKHLQVRELVGYPLIYTFSIGNRFVQKEDQSYFSFKVKGPKSTVNVQMTASNLPASEVYSYQQKNPKIQQLQSEIKRHEGAISSLQQEIKKDGSRKRSDLQLYKASAVNQIAALKRELVIARYDLLEKKQRYFVPEKKLYTKINDPRSKGSEQLISKEEKLWGINDLVITLPNRTKMIVLPEPKKSFDQKQRLLNVAESVDVPTVGTLNKRLVIDISEFSKQQIQEYGKQKTNFMYSKYSSIRMFSALLFMGIIAGVVMYKQKNTLRSIKGSILQSEVKRFIGSHPKIGQLLREKKKGELSYDNLIGGGIANDYFNCVLYINNLTNGRLQVEGKYMQQLNTYQYSKLLLKYREKDVKKEIDLLL